jgi:8-oxo-dGTP pyrophosphatase MutT (NUDIX family)
MTKTRSLVPAHDTTPGLARASHVRPQPAASLIAVKTIAGQAHVLMGRRVARSRFAPNVWVFPGGKLDSADASIRACRDLAPDTIASTGLTPAKARALAIAAVRETVEETGLMLGTPGDFPDSIDGAAWTAFRARGLIPDLSALTCIARAITPTSSPIRFHARFFRVDGALLIGDLGGSGELLDLDWLPLSRATALPLMDVTHAVLARLDHVGSPLTISYRGHRMIAR